VNRAARRAQSGRRPRPAAPPGDRARPLVLGILLVEGVLGLIGGLRFLQQAGQMTYLPLSGFAGLLGLLILVPAVVALVACWFLRGARARGRRWGLAAGWSWAVVAGLWTLVGVVSPSPVAVLFGVLVAGANVLVVRNLRDA
jgi:hypothetical protein